MALVIHRGVKPPLLRESMRPNESRDYWMSWNDRLPDIKGVDESIWILPPGFTALEFVVGQPVENPDAEEVLYNSNMVKISTTLTSGIHLIQNQIKTIATSGTSPETLVKGFYLKVEAAPQEL